MAQRQKDIFYFLLSFGSQALNGLVIAFVIYLFFFTGA